MLWPTILLTGCEQSQQRSMKGGKPLTTATISQEELRGKLSNFEEFFTSTIKQTAGEIDRQTSDMKLRKLTLLWRSRLVSTLNNMLEQDDALVAFIDTWALSVRMNQYFESGEGKEIFLDYQNIAVTAAKQIEQEIENIARTFLDDTVFADTQKNIRSFAAANPIQGAFARTMVYATEVKENAPNPFKTVISIPLAPFRAIEGVDRGAAAVYKFSNTAEKFSDIVQELPESTRWQLLLLLYELQDAETTKSFLTSLQTLSESSKVLAETYQQFPAQIRQETAALVKEIDSRQANIQKTLQQTEETSAALENLLAKLDETGQSIAAAAQAWQGAADSTTQIFTTLKKDKPEDQPKETFNINDLRTTAEAMTQTAAEIRLLNNELSQQLPQTSKHFKGLTNMIVWRIALLFVLAFCLAVAYRLISTRALKQKTKGQK